MAFGTFNRQPRYKQENPAAAAGNMAPLLSLLMKSGEQIHKAAEQHGKDSRAAKVAQVMAGEKAQGLDPDQLQQLILQTTGGSAVNDSMDKQIQNAYGSRGDVRSNTWKEDAATTLFGRQLKRDAINNAQSMARTKVSSAGRGGNGDGPLTQLLSPEQVGDLRETITQYDEALNSPGMDDATRSRIRKDRNTLMAKLVQGTAKKPSAVAVGAMSGIDKNGNFIGSPTKAAKANKKPIKISSEVAKNTMGWTKPEREAMQFGYDNLGIRMVPVMSKDGKKRIGTKFLRNGRQVTKQQMLDYYKRQTQG